MTAIVLTHQADCLSDLGRLDEASDKYRQAIERSEKVGFSRQVAIGKMQLAIVYQMQGKYADAIAGTKRSCL